MATDTGLTKAQAKELQKHLETIDLAKRDLVEGVLTIGRELVAVREILSHGEFLPWVEECCRFSKSTAYRYIDAFQAFGKFPKVENFDDSALYVLSKCEDAAAMAMVLASRGNFISHQKALELVEEAKAKPELPETLKPEADDHAPPADCDDDESDKPPRPSVPPFLQPHDDAGEDDGPEDEPQITHFEPEPIRVTPEALVAWSEGTKLMLIRARAAGWPDFSEDDFRHEVAAVLAVLDGGAA